MSFTHLRQTPWNPAFAWVGSVAEAAHQINSFHEDHPKRVQATAEVINSLHRFKDYKSNAVLKLIYLHIFADTSHRGRWREMDVQVGLHRPPDWQFVPALMDELETTKCRLIDGYEALEQWYSDFETIHPFQDGNGRVGGIIVAVYSHALHPERGWLAVEQ